MALQKPLLIFDGDCGFCRRWIERWKYVTQEEIQYAPYQEVQLHFPQISKEKFQKSVQLIEPLPGEEIRLSSGAEAVFRSLAYNSSHKWLLRLYEKLPGFRNVSETFYRLVAANRIIFSKLTALFWGKELRPSRYEFSSFIFLRFLALISGIAFYSAKIQISGLVGKNGILPAVSFLQRVAKIFPTSYFWKVPTLFWWISSDTALHAVCLAGIFFSAMLFLGILPNLMLFLIWAGYLSLVNVGQDFFSFQWDMLLLETLFLSFFLPPLVAFDRFRRLEPANFPRLLLKLLLFKLMFLSGMVKLASGDKTWHALTALQYHYETQPLPVWTSWYAHHLPILFHKISALSMFFIELVLPFLFFFPRRLRHVAAFATVGLQILIFVTGNYCFFNLLAIALCVLLVDDSFWKKMKAEPQKKNRLASFWLTLPIGLLVVGVSLSEMSWMWSGANRHSRKPGMLENWVAPFRSINHYGLFAVMTTERNEIILEGSLDGEEWKPYEFKYKPGDISERPRYVEPLQPRLDWQMWFAALGNFRQNTWYLNLCARLLQGEPEVLKLLKTNPFPDRNPKFIRGNFYLYHFSTPENKRKYGVWWEREAKGLYSPPISLKTS